MLNGVKKYIHSIRPSYGGTSIVMYGSSPSSSEYSLGMTYLHCITIQEEGWDG